MPHTTHRATPAARHPCSTLAAPALLVAAALALASPRIAQARSDTYLPHDHGEIVETLPAPGDPALLNIKRLRQRLNARPDDVAAVEALARANIDLARRNADPRYLGHAEALLTPWLQRRPEPALLVLQATVLQSAHRFDAAEALLQRALDQAPRDPQAWLTRLAIAQARGRYADARTACTHLAGLLDPGYGLACLAVVQGLTGEGERAYRALEQRVALAADWERGPLLISLAELASRLGRTAVARRWFQAALAATSDSYARAAYADFLLDAHEPAAVLELLADDERADPLLLRLAEAARATGAAAGAGWTAALAARFDAARARGEALHLREESRFRLRLVGDARGALELARRNWAVQREPADARALLEAALAAHQPAAAQAVLDWMRSTRVEDAALTMLARRLRA